MNKQDLINTVASKTGLTKKDTELVTNSILTEITEALANREKVSITGFGIWQTKDRAARVGRSPVTGEPIKIDAKVAPTFKAGKQLKELVNS